MKNNIQLHSMTLWRVFIFMTFLTVSLCGPAGAGAGESSHEGVPAAEATAQMTKVEVTLRGADSQEVVQIIDYILGKLSGVEDKKVVELHIVPHDIRQCLASWELTVQGISGLDIEEQFLTIANSLDLTSHNDILYEAPFIITAQDLEKVKQIKGRKASEYAAVFSLLEEDFEPFTVVNQNSIPSLGNPWLSVPGAGFE